MPLRTYTGRLTSSTRSVSPLGNTPNTAGSISSMSRETKVPILANSEAPWAPALRSSSSRTDPATRRCNSSGLLKEPRVAPEACCSLVRKATLLIGHGGEHRPG